MRADEAQRLMMALIDGELDAARRRELDTYLADHPEARAEFEEMRALAARTDRLRLAEPPPEMWEEYMTQLRPRLERGAGFGLLALGLTGLVVAFAILFIRTPLVPPGIKLLVGAAVGGLGMLFLSVWREKRFINRHERYGRVRR